MSLNNVISENSHTAPGESPADSSSSESDEKGKLTISRHPAPRFSLVSMQRQMNKNRQHEATPSSDIIHSSSDLIPMASSPSVDTERINEVIAVLSHFAQCVMDSHRFSCSWCKKNKHFFSSPIDSTDEKDDIFKQLYYWMSARQAQSQKLFASQPSMYRSKKPRHLQHCQGILGTSLLEALTIGLESFIPIFNTPIKEVATCIPRVDKRYRSESNPLNS